jgi:O-antigen/teichoic acid export membrane protein
VHNCACSAVATSKLCSWRENAAVKIFFSSCVPTLFKSLTIAAPSRALEEAPRRAPTFSSNVLVTLGANLLLAGMALVTGPLVARLTGPKGRGELAAIQTWPSFLATIAMLGLPDAVVYFTARNPGRAGRYLGSAILVALLSVVPFIAISYLLMPVLLAAQSTQVVHAARWYLLLLPIFAIVGMVPNSLRGRNNMLHWNLLRVMPSAGWLLLLIAANILHRSRPQWLAAAYLIILAAMFFPFFGVARGHISGSFTPDFTAVRPMLKYGLPSTASAVPNFLNLRLDQLLMAAWMAPISLGLYATAVAWSSAVNPLLCAIGAVLFPAVAAGDSKWRSNSCLEEGVRLGILVAAGVTVLLLLVTPMAFPLLFGPSFAPAIPAALVLGLAAAIAGINMILEEGLRGLGEPKSVLLGEVVGILFTAAALLLLLRRFNIMGAALASVIGYSAILITLIMRVRRLTGLPVIRLLPHLADLNLLVCRLLRAGERFRSRAKLVFSTST